MSAHPFPQDLDHPEFFTPRGIGIDGGFPCLVTGVYLDCAANIAAFVVSREAGERVVSMLGGRARLDFREYEPNWLQVKLGVSKGHEAVLQRLYDATSSSGNVITPRMIAWALDPAECPGYQPYGLRRIDEMKSRVREAIA
jgi:hypothetical protein